jgi:asparagine synthase (glutamine-hydrolysing)
VCGICGKLNFDREENVSPELVKAMADAIVHRGPDDEGYYVSGQIGLGFRRLSIIDLSTGHQPISNEDGTVWIVFNGEIYNFQELRDFLVTKGHRFKTKTDTEVIVHLYEEFGESCVERLRGMFAFAIWDQRDRSLFLARDRVGIKPLYYSLSNRSLIFASEIKALLADPDLTPEVLPEMVDRFLTFYYVPGEQTFLKNVLKLAPGTHMKVRNGIAEVKQYWDLEFTTEPRSFQQAEAELLEILDEATQQHMISDVPVGILLSGGLDSTALLSLATGKTGKSLSSFTLGFSTPGLADERPFARLAAKRFGTDHYEMTISSQEFADFLPSFAWHMEEPVCEPQAVALYYVSRLAKDHVKVLISGEGGDEAFAGYPNHRNMMWLERIKKVLGPFNNAAASGLSLLNGDILSGRILKYGPLLRIPFESYYFSRISTVGTYFNQNSNTLYTSAFLKTVDKTFSLEPLMRYFESGPKGGLLNKMLYVDTKTSLPDDLLLKADKMTMANSIELRVPMLDHKVLEFAASLPEKFKVRGLTAKYIAKRALRKRVPKEIINRKKAGFPVPYASWMRTELKDWVADILLDRETTERGYFKRESVAALIHSDINTKRHPKEILSLVALELWHRAFLKKSPSRVDVNRIEVPSEPLGNGVVPAAAR